MFKTIMGVVCLTVLVAVVARHIAHQAAEVANGLELYAAGVPTEPPPPLPTTPQQNKVITSFDDLSCNPFVIDEKTGAQVPKNPAQRAAWDKAIYHREISQLAAWVADIAPVLGIVAVCLLVWWSAGQQKPEPRRVQLMETVRYATTRNVALSPGDPTGPEREGTGAPNTGPNAKGQQG